MSFEQPNKLHGTNDDVTNNDDVTGDVVRDGVTSQNTRNVVLPPISFQTTSSQKKSPKRRALRRKKSKGGVLELDDATTNKG